MRSRRRAASSKRRSRASRLSLARSFGSASSSVSHVDALERTCRELRPLAARQRPELRRLRGADDAVAATAEIEVPVGTHGARIRGRPQLADQAQLLERRLELRAEHAPFDPLERSRAPPRRPAAAAPSGSTSAAGRAGRGPGRRRAPGRARRGRGRRPAAAARRRRAPRLRWTRRGAVAASSTRSATVRAPRSCAMPDQPHEDLRGRLGVGQRAMAGTRVGREPVRQRRRGSRAGVRAAGARARPCRPPSPPTRCPVSRIVSWSRNAMSKRALCATSTASPANARKRRTAAATGGARRSSSSRRPVKRRRSPAGRRTPGLASVWNRVGRARAARPARRRTRRTGRARPESPVVSRSKTTNVRLLEEQPLAGRSGERDEVARPAQPRVGLHRLVEQRPREARRERRSRAAGRPVRPRRPATGPRRSSTSSTSRSAASRRSCTPRC